MKKVKLNYTKQGYSYIKATKENLQKKIATTGVEWQYVIVVMKKWKICI